jgi:ribose transport system substrate-binding protein
MRLNFKYLLALAAMIVAAMVFAACGGGGSSSSSTEAASTSAESETTEASSEESGGEAGIAAAKAAIAPYIGQASPFPVTEKLKKLPTGDTVIYANCGTPICGVFGELFGPAAETLGMKFKEVKTGISAATIAPAMESIIQQHPDAVIAVGQNFELWSQQLKQLQEEEIPVVTSGIVETEKYGLGEQQGSNYFSETTGKLMADYIPVEFSPESNIVFYAVPELPFSPLMEKAFLAELETSCPSCSVRTVNIPVESIGNTAPNQIVSDLQANPETTLAVFASDETEAGVPAAMKAAGLEVETMGSAPGPTQLQYIKEGKEGVGLGFDLPVSSWTMLDIIARQLAGQELKGLEAEGVTPQQFLTQKDINFDPSKGWTGYPEFAETFAKLWGVGG